MARCPERIVVLGAGGHGRMVADAARALGHDVVGYADADEAKLGVVVDHAGGSVLLTQAEMLRCARGERPWPATVDAIALGVGDNAARVAVLRELDERLLPPIVHPAAWVSPGASVGAGSVVLPGAVVNTDARIADAVIVNSRATVEHDCVLATGVHVSPGATLCGNVSVGELSWVAAGAVVIPGLSIGRRATVGAGAVVVRDVPDGVVVVGNPARVLPRGHGGVDSPRAPLQTRHATEHADS